MNFKFVGREGYYREGELYLLGQRWYDSEVGRFISRDPIGEKGGVNLYVYVGNNPVNSVDPEGFQEGNACRKFACNPNPALCQDCCDEICAMEIYIPIGPPCTRICYGICDIALSPQELRKRLLEVIRGRRNIRR